MRDLRSALDSIREYLTAVPSVSMAFAFGSRLSGVFTTESDLDIAVYFTPRGSELDLEADERFPLEDELWDETERRAGIPVDFVVLNRAPATLAHAALARGRPLLIRDPSLFWRYYLAVSAQAQDFREFTEDYIAIKQRSGSLSPIDRTRLLRIIDFIETELADLPSFTGLSEQDFRTRPAVRRNLERFAENLINASIDVAKILLAAERHTLPETYREALAALSTLERFPREVAASLASFARLRNVLAHEYLDLRYPRLREFIDTAGPIYRSLADQARKRIGAKDETPPARA